MNVLVIGGTGGFGQSICRQLDAEGHRVVALGRSRSSGARLVGQNPRIQFVIADRGAIDAAFMRTRGIEAVVDASGSFQSRGVGLARCAIFAGVHYIDISDDEGFIARIEALAAEARAAGIVIVSGASSTPGLSGAVVARCVEGMERVDAVDISITASNQAVFGEAVLEAMLDRAGAPFVRGFGRERQMIRLRRITLKVRGAPGLTRSVLRCESADERQISRVCGDHVLTRFWAGGEADWQNRAMQIVAWLVRSRMLSTGVRMLRMARLGRGLSSPRGGGRSGMKVRVIGSAHGRRMVRTWTLIAEDGQGPLLPALGVPAVVAAISDRGLKPGVVRAADVMDVDAVIGRMPVGAVRHEMRTVTTEPLYSRIMGEDFGALHPAIVQAHSFGVDRLEGLARVDGAGGAPARLVSRMFGFPREADEVPVTVRFDRRGSGETWTRTFGDRTFSSHLDQKGGLLRERFGPLRFTFRLMERDGGIAIIPVAWSLLGMPLPGRLQPDGVATERGLLGAFTFDVPINVPIIGKVEHYRGHLRPSVTASPPGGTASASRSRTYDHD